LILSFFSPLIPIPDYLCSAKNDVAMIKKQYKSLQKLIDRCVKHDYDAAKEALSMKISYLSGEQRPDYIRKEIFDNVLV
jgi:hypothetical protein